MSQEETKTVEFENGNEVTVAADGRVVNVEEHTAVDEFFDSLAEKTEVERRRDNSGFFGSGGTDVLSNKEHVTSVVDIADETGVEIDSCWPVLDGDDTDLAMYIYVVESE